MTRTYLAINFGLIALLPFIAMNDAQACAACGDTLSKEWGTQGISTHPGFTADLSYSYVNQNQQRLGTGTASPASISARNLLLQEIEDYTTTRTTTASLNYSSDDWGINTQLPFVQRTHGTFGTTTPMGSSYSSSSDNGIGDIRVIGRYTGFSAYKTAGIIAGIKLPTGSTNANFNSGTGAGFERCRCDGDRHRGHDPDHVQRVRRGRVREPNHHRHRLDRPDSGRISYRSRRRIWFVCTRHRAIRCCNKIHRWTGLSSGECLFAEYRHTLCEVRLPIHSHAATQLHPSPTGYRNRSNPARRTDRRPSNRRHAGISCSRRIGSNWRRNIGLRLHPAAHLPKRQLTAVKRTLYFDSWSQTIL